MIGGAGSLEQGALSPHFPANREFYREILSFLLSFTHGAAWYVAQLKAFRSPSQAIMAQKEQGIYLRYQGINVPCYGFEQRELVNSSMTLSRRTPSDSH
jgi:hypothetical protein